MAKMLGGLLALLLAVAPAAAAPPKGGGGGPPPGALTPTRVTLIPSSWGQDGAVLGYDFRADFTAVGPVRTEASASVLLLGARGHYWGQDGDPACQGVRETRPGGCRGSAFYTERTIYFAGAHRGETLSTWAVLTYGWRIPGQDRQFRTILIRPCLPPRDDPAYTCPPLTAD